MATFTKKEIADFMRSISVMSAACSLQGKPISTILLFALDDDFTLYFATRRDSYKQKALSMNSQMSISVWEHKKMLVQSSGHATQIIDENAQKEALTKIVNATDNIEDFWPPVLQINGGDYTVYKYTPEWLRAMDLSNTKIKTGDTSYTEFQF